jgi:SH3-like domain-containing protein
MTEEELQRWRRAKEVLDGAGWVFDEFVNAKMAAILTTGADDVDGRERLVRAARVATQLKLSLMGEVEQYEASKQLADRREQRMEGRNGRREQHVN